MEIEALGEHSVRHAPSKRKLCDVLWRMKRKIFSWYVLKTVALGQMLSLFICGTAVTSQFLADQYKVNTPMFQSFINYCLLFLIYTSILAFRTGENSLLYIVKNKWWKYILLGIADVEANYAIVKAYQYTSITSVQLLDCIGIPVLMALSWFILRSRYRLIHFAAVVVCLGGVGTMVGADVLAGREQGKGSDMLIGDALVLLGASLYAVSNVCEEYIVKNLSREEFLGMVGLFGTFISGIQLIVLEYADVAAIQWDWKVALLFTVFALCMFGLYSLMPLVIQVTSATSVNLGILTADLYSLFFGLFLFGYSVNASLQEGFFLESFNQAFTTPILRKLNLDANDPSTYRPISGLPYQADCEGHLQSTPALCKVFFSPGLFSIKFLPSSQYKGSHNRCY